MAGPPRPRRRRCAAVETRHRAATRPTPGRANDVHPKSNAIRLTPGADCAATRGFDSTIESINEHTRQAGFVIASTNLRIKEISRYLQRFAAPRLLPATPSPLERRMNVGRIERLAERRARYPLRLVKPDRD